MLEVECPRCGANVEAEPEMVLARHIMSCPACGRDTDLDPARCEAAETFRARRAFSSSGPRPTVVRRYRVEVAPVAEAAPDVGGRRPPSLAAAPALGREPFGLGDTSDLAVESLQRIVRRLGEAGLLPAPLPPSDADPQGRWIEASD